MLAPNKIISIGESCLYRAALLLPRLKDGVGVVELYKSEKRMFLDLADFIDTLDLLFILGRIVLDENGGVIKHA